MGQSHDKPGTGTKQNLSGEYGPRSLQGTVGHAGVCLCECVWEYECVCGRIDVSLFHRKKTCLYNAIVVNLVFIIRSQYPREELEGYSDQPLKYTHRWDVIIL